MKVIILLLSFDYLTCRLFITKTGNISAFFKMKYIVYIVFFVIGNRIQL